MHAQTLAVDGLRVNVAEWGAGDPVVLLHGLTGSLDYWAPFAERLGRSHRVIAVDVPGHGDSDVLDPFSFTEAVRLMGEAIDQIGVDQPAVVGHSFGAPLAITWAAERPVSAMVLASPVGMAPFSLRRARFIMPFHRAIAATERLWEKPAATRRLPRKLVFGWFVGMSRTEGLDVPAARRLLRGAAKAAPIVPGVLPALASLDLPALIERVTARSLIIWGEHDRSGWENGPALAEALAGEELVLPGVGHMPMIEAPYSFGVAVAEFVGASVPA
jgi:pimeloyl-ACP methyl ester carboxylesterase